MHNSEFLVLIDLLPNENYFFSMKYNYWFIRLFWVTQSFFSFVLLCDNFLLHRVTRSFARSYTKFFFHSCYFVIIFVTQSFTEFCTELHRVFFPPCSFVIIFCYTELHGVLHGVTQSFFFSFVLLYITFLLHRVARSFARSYTEFFSSVLLYDNFLLHRLSQSVIVSSVLLCEYSVVLCETFFHSLKSQWFSPCPYVKPLLQKIYKTNLLIPSLRLLV